MKKILTLLILLLVFTGCTKQEEVIKNDKPIEEEPIKETLKIMNPFSKTRPIAIMINNHPVARPNHSGLQDAYVIYEIIVEGGFTRFLALYKDQETKRIGSVRSARHYFLDYALENDAIYVHFGGSPQALEEVNTLNMSYINFMNTGGAFRDTTLNVAYEHTAFTTIPNINNIIKSRKYRNQTDVKLFDYSIEELDLDKYVDANKINIEYSSSVKIEYNYNPITKTYERKVNNIDHKDAITGNIYDFKNIIIYGIENRSMDSYGRQELYNLVKTNGYYISNGKVVPITVEKTKRNEKTVYKNLDGSELILNDGNTFIQIVPLNKKIEIK